VLATVNTANARLRVLRPGHRAPAKPYSDFLPAAFALAQRALAAAAIFARAAALIFLLAFLVTTGAGTAGLTAAFALAQRALTAATILALPAALIRRLDFRGRANAADSLRSRRTLRTVTGSSGAILKMAANCFSSASIFSRIAAALWSCCEVSVIGVFAMWSYV